MKKDKYIWLSISLFAPRSKWRFYFSDLINPFLRHWHENQRIASHQILFDYTGGSNIKIPLLIVSKEARRAAEKIHLELQSFFQAIDFSPQLGEGFNNQIFKDFPQNSIHYGLYKTEPTKSLDTFPLEIHKNVSDVIIEVFSSTEIDDESILTVALYLSITWVYNFKRVIPDKSSHVLDFYYNHSSEQLLSKDDQMTLISLCENLKLTFQEISQQIHEKSYPVWVSHWIDFLQHSLKFETFEQRLSWLGQGFHQLIVEHLGLSYFSGELVRSAIRSMLLIEQRETQ